MIEWLYQKKKGRFSTLVKHEAVVMNEANPLVNGIWLLSSRVVAKVILSARWLQGVWVFD